MRWFFAALIAVLALGHVVRAEVLPADHFDGERAWWADSVLCTPSFEGRRPATEGATAAEDWIAARFAEIGLLPGSAEGTYFQEFPVIGFEEKKTSLELLDSPFGKIRLVHGDDYVLLHTPAAGKMTAEAVLIGYGIDAPEKGRDDYEGCDLQGKIAVIVRGRPEDGQDWSNEYSRNHTFPAAIAHGAVAVLYCQRETAIAGAALRADAYDPNVPGAYISERVIHLLLRETGWRFEEVKEKLKEGAFSLPTGKRLRFSVDVRGQEAATGRNVLAVLRGTDPILGTEVVMFGAHHDHIGFDAGGRLYAGANDNASGTSVVLELARAVTEAGWRPRRTVYFVTFSGEEMGLLGSRHLAGDLPFDSTKFVAMINLDMAGHGDGGFGLAGGTRIGPPYFEWRDGIDSIRAAGFEEYQLGGGYSDYAPFAERGIPAMSSWSRGDHHRYHDFEDLPRYVLPECLEAVGRGVGSLIVHLADYPFTLADGYGRERALRSKAMQVVFSHADATQLTALDRSSLDGMGRIAGRLVALDFGNGGVEIALQRLGHLMDLESDREWIDLAKGTDEIEDAWDELHVGLLPTLGTPALDRLEGPATTVLCRAGLAGAYWPSETEAPSPATCAALAGDGRFLLVDASSAWDSVRTTEEELRILVQADRDTDVPAAPDSSLRVKTRLILTVEGPADSTRIRQAVAAWDDRHLHIDIAAGLEADASDEESLLFIRWLRNEGWSDERIEAALGGNLKEL